MRKPESFVPDLVCSASIWTAHTARARFAGLFLLLPAATLPSGEGETFGSMWPLVGYDNAIDALHVRDPWLVRFQEMDEMDRERNVTHGMKLLFEDEENHAVR